MQVWLHSWGFEVKAQRRFDALHAARQRNRISVPSSSRSMYCACIGVVHASPFLKISKDRLSQQLYIQWWFFSSTTIPSLDWLRLDLSQLSSFVSLVFPWQICCFVVVNWEKWLSHDSYSLPNNDLNLRLATKQESKQTICLALKESRFLDT